MNPKSCCIVLSARIAVPLPGSIRLKRMLSRPGTGDMKRSPLQVVELRAGSARRRNVVLADAILRRPVPKSIVYV
jgi:hypothetical protein